MIDFNVIDLFQLLNFSIPLKSEAVFKQLQIFGYIQNIELLDASCLHWMQKAIDKIPMTAETQKFPRDIKKIGELYKNLNLCSLEPNMRIFQEGILARHSKKCFLYFSLVILFLYFIEYN